MLSSPKTGGESERKKRKFELLKFNIKQCLWLFLVLPFQSRDVQPPILALTYLPFAPSNFPQ